MPLNHLRPETFLDQLLANFWQGDGMLRIKGGLVFALLMGGMAIPLQSRCQVTDTVAEVNSAIIKPVAVENEVTAASTEVNSKRVTWVAAINAVGFAGSLALLNNAWYKDEPRGSFHFFNDSKEWLQVDKFGHTWSAYNAARATGAMWKWTGLPHKKAVWIGGLTSFTYMTGLEFLDAFAEKWGWSWSDIAANTVGVGMYVSQELAWQEQRIQLKFSFHRNSYKDPQLEARADELYGSSWYERMLKDYNAQTYWFSGNIRSFFPESNWPPWLNLAIGYGATGMYGGFENKWMDGQGQEYDRTDIKRTRQFYFAPDIDFTRIKTNSKLLRTTFSILNAFKFPAPALMINGKGKISAYALYF